MRVIGAALFFLVNFLTGCRLRRTGEPDTAMLGQVSRRSQPASPTA